MKQQETIFVLNAVPSLAAVQQIEGFEFGENADGLFFLDAGLINHYQVEKVIDMAQRYYDEIGNADFYLGVTHEWQDAPLHLWKTEILYCIDGDRVLVLHPRAQLKKIRKAVQDYKSNN